MNAPLRQPALDPAPPVPVPGPAPRPGVAAGMAEGWHAHRVLLVTAWGATLALCALAVWLGQGLYYFLDFRDGGGRWAGVFSVLSAGCLALAGFGLLLVARLTLRRGAGDTAAWVFGGLGAIFLALDDLLQLHESAARVLARAGVPAPFGLDRDLYVLAAYGAAALYAVRGVWPRLRSWRRSWLPGMAAVLGFAASAGVDLLPWDALSPAAQQGFGAAEEIAKTLGAVSLALFAMVLVEQAAAGREQPRLVRRG